MDPPALPIAWRSAPSAEREKTPHAVILVADRILSRFMDLPPNPAQPEPKGVANPGRAGTKEGCLGLRLQTPGTRSSLTELGRRIVIGSLALKNMAIARAAAT
jgi:hypothetical protein